MTNNGIYDVTIKVKGSGTDESTVTMPKIEILCVYKPEGREKILAHTR